EQALGRNVGRSRYYVGVGARLTRDFLPACEAAVDAADLDVGCDAQDSRAQLLLKSVHDREHHDERHDPDRDANHGRYRDERDEMVAALGAWVAQTDEQLVRAHR